MGLVPSDCTTLHAHLPQTMNALQKISSAYHEHTNYGMSLPTQISVFCPDYLSFVCWPGNNPTGTTPHIHTWNLQILSQKSNFLLLMLSLCLLEWGEFVTREFISLVYEAVSQDVDLTSEGKRIHVLMLSHVISFHLFFWVTTAQNLRLAEQLTDFLASEYVEV